MDGSLTVWCPTQGFSPHILDRVKVMKANTASGLTTTKHIKPKGRRYYIVIVSALCFSVMVAFCLIMHRNMVAAEQTKRLISAVTASDLNGMRLSLNEGADANARMTFAQTDLTWAYWLRLLSGGDHSSSGDTVLIALVEMDDLDGVKLLLKYAPDTDAHNDDGRTALMQSCFMHEATITKMLLEAGANTSLTDLYGNTALSLAKSNGSKPQFDLIQGWQRGKAQPLTGLN
jgi:hypothetical protein